VKRAPVGCPTYCTPPPLAPAATRNAREPPVGPGSVAATCPRSLIPQALPPRAVTRTGVPPIAAVKPLVRSDGIASLLVNPATTPATLMPNPQRVFALPDASDWKPPRS